jgi:predicted tellurium resistance membrane protein TerC
MKKSVSILVRLLLVLLVGADVILASMTGYHWQRGGTEGVKAWITHMHLASGRSFDVPVTQAMISRSLTEFTYVVVTLLLLTFAMAFADHVLRRQQKHA